ncbi:hypothetical protein [Vibrio crassostreae]|uniref:Uncharacterized protein n=1 Tax=Vibrio crassostreae TaxID=246167 RepID=A0ABP1WVX4_9VIBR|nr:hypothetical protein [Vibrio crassostreae]ROS63519.1 hypothetical protein EDB73_11084 [Vibrio crassostreae]RPF24045.1 hypothetical protein EDB12_0899 [Vibrio crassostreae]TCL29202.1 hypothetical protein EDB52_102490 [Vibrio crassostreae]TCT51970.1 hypothetical protein EDB39_102491 [Vibrio crassostreae]TCT60579.1 hypothetical protein EDB40_1036 [Vibrio crassostreae]
MTVHNKIATLTSVLILFGCNQEQGSQATSTEQHSTITTQDIVNYSPENTVSTLNLTQAVSVDSSEKVRLSAIEPLSDYNQCTIVEQKGLIAHIATDNSQVCRFIYSAEVDDSLVQSSGIAQIVVSDNQLNSAPLRPLTRTVQHSSTLQIKLKDILPTSTHVSQESIELYADTSTGATGNVSLEGDSLHYTAPQNTSGAVRLFYTAQDEQLTLVHPGVVYITISESNTAPIAQTNTELPDKVLADYLSKRFIIDIRDYISDDDNNDLQLIEVYTNGLGTRDILPWSTQFEYAPGQSGEHYVNYVVTDHYGGYAIGSLHFNVLHYSSIYDEQQNMTFSATYTLEELSRMDGTYSGVFMEIGTTGEPGYYPIFDRQLAQAYCTRKGQTLPSKDQIRQLFQNHLTSQPAYQTSYHWPSGMPYVGSDGTVSLYDGTYKLPDTAGYLTCISALANPSEYSFDHANYGGNWDETVAISASQELTPNEKVPLPTNEYQLKYNVMSTVPPRLENLIQVELSNNKITVSRHSTAIKRATLELSSPNIAGNTNTTSLLIGLNECPQNATVEEIHTLSCIPVIYEDNGIIFTGTISDPTLSEIGFILSSDATPSRLRKTHSNPDYSYFIDMIGDGRLLHYSSLENFVQPLCDKLNASSVAGRNNWRWSWDIYDDGELPSPRAVNSSLASSLTNWLLTHQWQNSPTPAQGYFYLDTSRQYQQRQSGYLEEIELATDLGNTQFITCVSAP